MRRIGVTWVLLTALLGPATGCSILFVKGPPPEGLRGPIVHCTESNVAPLIDMMIASWQTVRIALALSASDADYRNAQISRLDDVAIGASLLALFAASSIIGFHQTSACREALLEDDNPRPRPRPRASRQPPPWKLGPPPPSQQKLEEEAEERAVRARSADMARAAREANGPDGGAAQDDEPAVVPANPRPAPQRADPE